MEVERDSKFGRSVGGIDVLSDDLIEDILMSIPCCATLLAVRKCWGSIIVGVPFAYFHQIRSARHSLVGRGMSLMRRTTWSSGQGGRTCKVSFTMGENADSHFYRMSSCRDLVLFLRYSTNQSILVCNSTIGESLMLPPLDPPCYPMTFLTVALGFHPPTKKYSAIIVCDTSFHIVTLGHVVDALPIASSSTVATSTSPWTTYNIPADYPRLLTSTEEIAVLWQRALAFCYNRVVYIFVKEHQLRKTDKEASMVTFDLEIRMFDVHHDISSNSRELCLAAREAIRWRGGGQSLVIEVIHLRNFGRMVDVWWAVDGGDFDSFHKVDTYKT